MRKIFVLSMLVHFAMICSCQKQDSTAEQQLTQRKVELDEREKALDEREKALAQTEKAATSTRRLPADAQLRSRSLNAAQLKAERDKRIQQLPADVQVQGLIADPARIKAQNDEKDSRIQERLAQRQSRMEELQKTRMPRKIVPRPAEVTSPTLSLVEEATSPSPSPTPE
jgi:hypothetical protein